MNDTIGSLHRRWLLAGVAAVAWAAVPGQALAACPALNPYAIFPDAGGACGVASVGTAAAKVASTQPLAFTGDATGSGTLGGGGFALTLPNLVTPGSGPRVTVNAKGQVTAINPLTAADIATGQGFTAYPNTNPAGYVTSATAGVASVSGLTGVVTAPQLAPTLAGKTAATLASGSAAAGSAYALDYGAVCDGASHPVGTTLGLTTLAQIQTKYPWLTNGAGSNWNYYSHQNITGDTPTGAFAFVVPSALGIPIGATITAATGVAVGTTSSNVTSQAGFTVTVSAAVATGAITIPVTSSTGVWPGQLMPTIAGIPFNDSVTSLNATSLGIGIATTAPIASGTVIYFPPVGVVQFATATTAAMKGVLSGGGQTTAYGGLTNANSVLNFTAVLTDAQAANAEVAWLAAQSAIQASGRVVMPPGKCVMVNSNNVGTGLGTLVRPVASTAISTAAGTPADVTGTNETGGVLSYPVDLGVGRVAIVDGTPDGVWANGLGRYAPGSTYSGTIGDLSIIGPGDNVTGIGQRAVWMDGVRIGARTRLTRLNVRGFNSNIDTIGDGQSWNDVESRYGYCDVRLSDGTSAIGSHNWQHPVLSNALLAAVCIGRNAVVQDITMVAPQINTSPYAFLMEAGTTDNYGGPNATYGIQQLHMEHAQITYIGNGVVIDDNQTRVDGNDGGSKARNVVQLTCEPCNVTMGGIAIGPATGYREGRTTNHMFSVNSFGDWHFGHMPYSSIGSVSGMTSIIDANSYNTDGGVVFEGHLASFNTLAVPLLSGKILNANALPSWTSIITRTPGLFSGHTEFFNPGVATQLYVGMVLEQNASTAGSVLGTASAAGIKGVTVQTATNGNGAGVAVATAGEIVPVLGPATGIIPGSWLKKAAGGVTALATGPTDVGVVGYATGFATQSGQGPGAVYNLWPVHLCIGGQ